MSNIGSSNNTFRITGKYLDLLNDFIVKAKINPALNESKIDQLKEFFDKINDIENIEPEYQLLTSIIERELRRDRKNPLVFIDNLVHELEDNKLEEAMPKIRIIAEALDSENTKALLKIKGE